MSDFDEFFRAQFGPAVTALMTCGFRVQDAEDAEDAEDAVDAVDAAMLDAECERRLRINGRSAGVDPAALDQEPGGRTSAE